MTVVFTLIEGEYHHGAASLCNSLFHAGFNGTVFVGYRGTPPPWLSKQEWRTGEGRTMDVRGVEVLASYHLTNHKAAFFQRIWNELCPEAETIFYIDPDIVIKRSWTYFDHWGRCGVCLVEDVNAAMPENHPVRYAWKRFLGEIHFEVCRPVAAFYNGGFVGVPRSSAPFIDRWEALMRAGEQHGFDRNSFAQRMDDGLFLQQPDQDFLNMCVMSSTDPLSTVGPQEMDFVPGGTLMSHAIGTPKPWKKQFIKEALLGRAPSPGDKNFWFYAEGPISSIPLHTVKRQHLILKVASLIGRFYGRR